MTGDTLLPILRLAEEPKTSNLKLQNIPIVDVKPGDYVLSLDEETQKIEPHRINGLLDMGVKTVYKLITASGRSIKTTANHPYLTRHGWVKVSGLMEGIEICIPNLEIQANLFKCNFPESFLIAEPLDGIQNFNTCKSTFTVIIRSNPLYKVFGRYCSFFKSYIKGVYFWIVGNSHISSLFKVIDINSYYYNLIMFFNKYGSYLFSLIEFIIPILIMYKIFSTFKSIQLSFFPDRSFNSIFNLFFVSSPVEKLFLGMTTQTDRFYSFQHISHNISLIEKLSRLFSAAEVEAAEIGSDILWDRIVSIEYMGYEHVYDIEVEGTHNFIGNGIFAHNTYISASRLNGDSVSVSTSGMYTPEQHQKMKEKSGKDTSDRSNNEMRKKVNQIIGVIAGIIKKGGEPDNRLIEEINSFAGAYYRSDVKGLILFNPITRNRIVFNTKRQGHRIYKLRFIYMQGVGLFIAFIDKESGEFILFNPSDYLMDASIKNPVSYFFAGIIPVKKLCSFEEFVKSPDSYEYLKKVQMIKRLKKIIKNYIRGKVNGVGINEKLREEIENFPGFTDMVNSSRVFRLSPFQYKVLGFRILQETGSMFNVYLRLWSDNNLYVIISGEGRHTVYALDRYIKKYREYHRSKNHNIRAIILPSGADEDVDRIINRAIETRYVETVIKTEEFNEIIKEYVFSKIKGKGIRRELEMKIRNFGQMFYITDDRGNKVFIPIGTEEKGRSPVMRIYFVNKKTRCLLDFIYDEEKEDLKLRVIDEESNTGYLFSLDRYIDTISGGGVHEVVLLEKLRRAKKAPIKYRKSVISSMMDRLRVLKLIGETGYSTVWDYLRSFQENIFPVCPEDIKAAVGLRNRLRRLYNCVTDESIRRMIGIEIERLEIFIKNPRIFEYIRLGKYGEVFIKEGVRIRFTANDANQAFMFNGEQLSVLRNNSLIGRLLKEVKLCRVSDNIAMEINGKKLMMKAFQLLRQYKDKISILAGDLEVEAGDIRRLFMSEGIVNEEARSIDVSELPGCECLAEEIGDWTKTGQIGKESNVESVFVDSNGDRIMVVRDAMGEKHNVPLKKIDSIAGLLDDKDGLIREVFNEFNRLNVGIYTFSDLVGDLFGYADCRGGDNLIAVYEGIKGSPIAMFHEVCEYLMMRGIMELEVIGVRKKKMKVKINGKRIGRLVNLSRDALRQARKASVYPDRRNHYLIRALQRQIFGKEDVGLTKYIKEKSGKDRNKVNEIIRKWALIAQREEEPSGEMIDEINEFNLRGAYYNSFIDFYGVGIVKLTPIKKNTLLFVVNCETHRICQLKFVYREGFGLFIALIGGGGRFKLYDISGYLGNVSYNEDIQEQYTYAEGIEVNTKLPFEEYIQQPDFIELLEGVYRKREFRKLIKKYSGYRIRGEEIPRGLIQEINNFKAFNDSVGDSGIFRINPSPYRRLMFSLRNIKAGTSFSVGLRMGADKNLYIYIVADGGVFVYALDRYIKVCKIKKPRGEYIDISAIRLPDEIVVGLQEEILPAVDEIIKRSIDIYFIETVMRTYEFNEIIMRYILQKNKGEEIDRDLRRKIKEFSPMPFVTDAYGRKTFLPFERIRKGVQSPRILIQMSPKEKRICLVDFVHDEDKKELLLRVLDKDRGTGYLFSLGRYIEVIKEEGCKWSYLEKRYRVKKDPVEYRRNIERWMEPIDRERFKVLRLIGRTGYATVWDYLRSFQESIFPVSPEDIKTVVKLRNELRDLYNSVTDESVRKMIGIEIERLELFIKNPRIFEYIRLGSYGEVFIKEGVRIRFTANDANQAFMFKGKCLNVLRNTFLIGRLLSEAALCMVNDNIVVRINGRKLKLKAYQLLRQYKGMIGILAGDLEVKTGDIRRLFMSEGIVNEEAYSIDVSELPGCECLAEKIKEWIVSKSNGRGGSEPDGIKVARTFNGVRVNGVSENVKKAISYTAKWIVEMKDITPDETKITQKRYVLVNRDKARIHRETIDEIGRKWNVEFITELPKGVNKDEVVVLLDPMDIYKYKQDETMRYLPLPYMRLSFVLAAELSREMDIKSSRVFKFVKGFYENLLCDNISDNEIMTWFSYPWGIKDRLISLRLELESFSIAVRQLDESA